MATLYETLEKIDKLKQHKRKVDQLKEAGDFTLKTILQGTYSNIDMKLPPGSPPFKENEDEDVAIVAKEFHSVIQQVMNGRLKQWERETAFTKYLEKISVNDAKILLAMKDKDLTPLFPTLTKELAKEAFPQMIK